MNNQRSQPVNFFVLSDSHGRSINPLITTPSFSIITKAISGLQWIDYRNEHLSTYALLSLPDIQSYLSQANAVLFIIGTNSVRSMPATKIIPQIQQIILHIQQTYPQLNQDGKISISLTFPCLKRTNRHSTKYITYNINQYNEQLQILSSQMNFSTLDLHITENHLDKSGMHIHSSFDYVIRNSIINHFNGLIPPPPTTNSNSSLPSSSTSVVDQQNPSQSSTRTREAVDRRNKERHQKMKLKQKEHLMKRKIHSQWSMLHIKQYLKSNDIKYGRVLPIFNKTLRLQFNNQQDQDIAESQLGMDIFNEDRYQEFINNQQP